MNSEHQLFSFGNNDYHQLPFPIPEKDKDETKLPSEYNYIIGYIQITC